MSSISAYILIIIVIVLIGVAIVSPYMSTRVVTTTVVDKERVCDRNSDGNRECKYLVFTESGTFEVTDGFDAMRWNSSDFYGQIKRCHTYDLQVRGLRSGFMSLYPNIVKATDKGRADGCEP
jgi:hypothetical protein